MSQRRKKDDNETFSWECLCPFEMFIQSGKSRLLLHISVDRILHNSLSDLSVYFREITEVFSGSAVMFFLSYFLFFLTL